MDPDDAPPRLRWRLLGWLAGALLLLPVLYVAASGPVAWWVRYRYHRPDWIESYFRTLHPLIQQPETERILGYYADWWNRLPIPRSRQRQYHVDMLADNRAQFEITRKDVAEAEERTATGWRLWRDALNSHTELTLEQSREAIELRDKTAKLQKHLEKSLRPRLLLWEQAVQRAENALQEFDRGKQ